MKAAVLHAPGEPLRLEEVMPADIARMALWLAADDSRMCTAQTWVVDGGWT